VSGTAPRKNRKPGLTPSLRTPSLRSLRRSDPEPPTPSLPSLQGLTPSLQRSDPEPPTPSLHDPEPPRRFLAVYKQSKAGFG
jgi:hypothetical protein